MKTKNRKQKQKEYSSKYGDIPIDFNDRLSYMIDKFNLSESKMNEILLKKDTMLNNLFFYECQVVQLLEEPEGSCRPRFTLLKKNNFNLAAINNSMIHVYTPRAAEDNRYMKELCDDELMRLNQLINTPCVVQYDAFYKTPSSYNVTDIFLSEIGLIRPPICKPDWDNLGKKYCDMYNHNVWIDDALVFDASVHKYYSILPRIEIHLKYLNTVYNKDQFKRIVSRKDWEESNSLSYLDNKGRIVNNNVYSR